MPIDAFLFGGRRATVVPLVFEALDWEHGVFLGSIMGSETTAAAAGDVGELRFDPMAMLPFCGYHMADYFAHWLKIGQREGAQLPKIFMVNWFRKDDDGNFLWPGFGENSRVLAWIFRRCDGEAEAVETPIGLVPAEGALDTDGLDLSAEALARAARASTRRSGRPSCRRCASTSRSSATAAGRAARASSRRSSSRSADGRLTESGELGAPAGSRSSPCRPTRRGSASCRATSSPTWEWASVLVAPRR